ncbi:F-box protein PP2-B11-like [Carex rostrata]
MEQNPRRVNNGQIILARDLEIRQDQENIYQRLVLQRDPRFNEALQALHVTELRIRATVNLSQLLPNQTYSAHLIFKTTPNSRNLDTIQEAMVCAYDSPMSRDVCLERTQNTPNDGNIIGFPVERNGWMELELGAFLREPDNILGEVVVCLQENNHDEKTGLIVAAIEVRPA